MKQAVAVIAIVCALAGQALADDLEKGFAAPPDSAKPHTWWHWMNGNITKEGITADLEAMHRVGIGGAQIFNVGCGIPAGPVSFFTPEWREMLQYAVKEADRLGMELCMHNCAGWSSSGGPWNTPENAMQQLVTSEANVQGPIRFSGALPQPPTKLDFYRDIEVLAFPTPEGEDVTMRALSPKVTASATNFSENCLFDGKPNTFVTLPMPGNGKPSFIQLEFAQPFTARSVLITLASGSGNPRGVIQASGDGQKFTDVQPFAFPMNGGNDSLVVSLGSNPAPAQFYRINFAAAGPKAKRLAVAELSIGPCLRTDDLPAKSGMNMGSLSKKSAPPQTSVKPELVVRQDKIIDLTGRMKPDGQLDWNVPEGQWTILRIGYTPTGRDNHPAPEGGLGPECDKLSAEALDAHWAGFMQKVLEDLGPLAGKGKAFNNVLIDSYEVGGQNWTPKFREEFQRLRGYDPLPWLITITGRVVNNPDATERFLWDMRRTIADLFAEKYYGHFKELCNQRGLSASIEPYTGPYESLLCGAAADIPMGEFWVGGKVNTSLKLAASVGHIYGQPVIGAESFTAGPSNKGHGRWLDDPYALKALGDDVFCKGINRYIFHRYAMQPWTNRWPGMTMGQWGTHFDRTCTWWEQGSAWMKYVARSQFLLQQGRCVADAASFCGESAPVQMPEISPELPSGYNYDGINADVLLNQAEVKNGLLALKSGMSYRVLTLSQPDRTMTPNLLRKLRDFVAAGLTLVGPPPEKSPSLDGYPKCDAEIKALVAEMWGNCDGTTVTEHRLGKGNVVWGQTLEQVFAALNTKPDFEFAANSGSQLVFIHRLAGDADIYFASNQRDQFDSVDCTFRISGKVPELWHPDTGRIEQAPVWRDDGNRITVPLQFDPAGSVFVVFRNKAGGGDHVAEIVFPSARSAPAQLRQARYEATDDGQGIDVIGILNSQIRDGVLKIKVGNKTLGHDPALNHRKQLRVEYAVNDKVIERIVPENAMLEINLAAVPVNEPPAFELTYGTNGQVTLCAAVPGIAELKMASGKKVKLEVSDVPKPVVVSGPWELNFPPNWGAPAQISLPQLISWTEHADNGVKYFSGTATYVKEVEIPAEMLGTGHSLWLNLGQVKNIAEVSVNGKPLGILWKPPFRVDITGAAKAGKNKLEIKITNLWPNRLIGDEQLPPDCEWNENLSLKQWPQWLLDGKPSPTGRVTFTTWHHWNKDDELLPSGLLGPVILVAVGRQAWPDRTDDLYNMASLEEGQRAAAVRTDRSGSVERGEGNRHQTLSPHLMVCRLQPAVFSELYSAATWCTVPASRKPDVLKAASRNRDGRTGTGESPLDNGGKEALVYFHGRKRNPAAGTRPQNSKSLYFETFSSPSQSAGKIS